MNASDEYESTEMRMTTVPAVMVGGLMVRIMVWLWLWLWLRRSMVNGDRWSSDVGDGDGDQDHRRRFKSALIYRLIIYASQIYQPTS